MTSSPDPLTSANALWQRLTKHQPAVAAALAMQLRALPDTWAQRELGMARPHAVLELLPASDMPMEIAPHVADWEECPACDECEGLCRYHTGYATGYEELHRPLREISAADPTVTVQDALERLEEADEAAENGVLVRAVAQLIEGAQR
ncbi:hypothetical protein [Kitasatospora sp. NBC_01300]|uniref:hypothetical protein n=1 Tax=Kitasatospora sp. NBC_01300 TaxID=2903574 RepID=UPI002F9164E4|nr:hypothetical protein OG556_40155 [Kitasatospora sp. NBC_01300]